MVLAIGSRRLSKVALLIGGFLIFVGVTMVGMFALVLSRALDVSALERLFIDYQVLFLGVLLVIGVFDVVSGIILRHR